MNENNNMLFFIANKPHEPIEAEETQVLHLEISKSKSQDHHEELITKEEEVQTLVNEMLKATGDQLLDNLRTMVILIKEGHSILFVKNKPLMKSLMAEF